MAYFLVGFSTDAWRYFMFTLSSYLLYVMLICNGLMLTLLLPNHQVFMILFGMSQSFWWYVAVAVVVVVLVVPVVAWFVSQRATHCCTSLSRCVAMSRTFCGVFINCKCLSVGLAVTAFYRSAFCV